MKTAEEVLTEEVKKEGYKDIEDFCLDASTYAIELTVLAAMKAYAEQAIDRASEVAKVTVNNGYEDSVDDIYYDNCSNPIVSYCIEPNKQSILKVKQELK